MTEAKMTLDQFIEKLKGTRHMKWVLHNDRFIRSFATGACECPISAVSGNNDDFAYPTTAGASRLGLTNADAQAIVNAADRDGELDDALRSRLLSAVGLS